MLNPFPRPLPPPPLPQPRTESSAAQRHPWELHAHLRMARALDSEHLGFIGHGFCVFVSETYPKGPEKAKRGDFWELGILKTFFPYKLMVIASLFYTFSA